MVPGQEPPQGEGVALDPVGSADDQNGVVQHLEGALHLAGEVHMAGGVQQGDGHGLQGEHRLFGEDGDAPLPLLGVGVQKGVPVVHPAQAAQLAAGVQKSLGQGGLARVHMGQNAHSQMFVFHTQHPKSAKIPSKNGAAPLGRPCVVCFYCSMSRSGNQFKVSGGGRRNQLRTSQICIIICIEMRGVFPGKHKFDRTISPGGGDRRTIFGAAPPCRRGWSIFPRRTADSRNSLA